jgi:hypothetical protein
MGPARLVSRAKGHACLKTTSTHDIEIPPVLNLLYVDVFGQACGSHLLIDIDRHPLGQTINDVRRFFHLFRGDLLSLRGNLLFRTFLDERLILRVPYTQTRFVYWLPLVIYDHVVPFLPYNGYGFSLFPLALPCTFSCQTSSSLSWTWYRSRTGDPIDVIRLGHLG